MIQNGEPCKPCVLFLPVVHVLTQEIFLKMALFILGWIVSWSFQTKRQTTCNNQEIINLAFHGPQEMNVILHSPGTAIGKRSPGTPSGVQWGHWGIAGLCCGEMLHRLCAGCRCLLLCNCLHLLKQVDTRFPFLLFSRFPVLHANFQLLCLSHEV